MWATYLLRVPVGRRRGFVVGRWPADLRRTGLPADVDAWLTAAAGPDRAPVDAGRTGEALAAVAALAVDGAAGDLRDCADMREFVHAATRLLAVRVADVPRLVDRADPALADHRAVVEQWAAEDPDALIARLLRRPHRWLRELLVGALLAAHRREPHRDLPAVHRIAPAGWLSELAELLRETHTKEELVDLLRADFTAPGAPLHERSARIDRRTFFEELGLHNHDGTRDDLYPVALADAVAEVAGGGRVLHTARRYLAESDDISVGVAELLGALSGPVEPDLARDLVMVADNALAARAVLRQAADHNGRFPGSAEDWFTDVAALVGDADLRLAVFDLGASRLGQDASAAFLAAAMRSYADTGMTGIWSTVALGLADKAAEAEDARRKLDQARAEADAHRERLTAELRDARAAHDALAKDHATAVAQQARLRTDLETARSKQARLKTDHGTATAQRDRFRRDLDAERAAHTRLRSEHAATAAERDRLRRELDEARQQQETARFDLREPADARTREPDHPASAPPETPVEPDHPGRTTAEAEPLTRQGRRRAKRAERREGQWFSPLIKRNLGFFTALGVVAILLVLLTLAAVDFFEGWP
ncbi:hypothetical protein ACFQV2_26395 [Actinokineospora soli]|uniref:Uncharacterized protein n=1 Tax=Actinokineospora soli TaxID=1048753 RepID=A0ABW2TRJ8_9PSEU